MSSPTDPAAEAVTAATGRIHDDPICAPSLDSQQLYRTALEAVRYEGTLLWQIFVAFLLIHTVFISFLFNSLIGLHSARLYTGRLLAAVGGLALCLPWCASYLRNSGHYRYHLARARSIEPEGWHLYSGLGCDFSSGKPVVIGSETVRLTWLARRVRSGRMIPPVIGIFITFYSALILYLGLWFECVSLFHILQRNLK